MFAQRRRRVHGEGVNGRAGVQHDEGVAQHFGETRLRLPCQRMATGHDEHQPVLPVRPQHHARALGKRDPEVDAWLVKGMAELKKKIDLLYPQA